MQPESVIQFNKKGNFLKFFTYLALIILVSLSGCASIDTKQNPQLLSVTHGYAVLHLPRSRAIFHVKSLASNKTYSFITHGNKGLSGLWLPSGDYVFTGIYNEFTTTLEGYPNFTVKPGQITNLGALINFFVADKKVIWLPKIFSTTTGLISELKTELSPYLKTQEIIQWEPKLLPVSNNRIRASSGQGLIFDWIIALNDNNTRRNANEELTNAKTIEEFYQLAIKTLPPLQQQEPASDDKGNLYYGADLGYIKKRTINGIWKTIDTHTYTQIMKVAWYNHKLYATTAYGEVVSSLDEGQTWNKVFQLGEHEIIIDLDFKDNQIFVLTLKIPNYFNGNFSDRTLTVYSKQKQIEELKSIKVIKSSKTPPGFLFGDIKAVINNDHYYVGFKPNKLIKMNINFKTWSDVKIPNDFTSFNISERGIITLFKAAGFFSKLSLSEDDGKSWNTIGEPSHAVYNIFFDDMQNGISHRMEINMNSSNLFVQKYNSKKNTG